METFTKFFFAPSIIFCRHDHRKQELVVGKTLLYVFLKNRVTEEMILIHLMSPISLVY